MLIGGVFDPLHAGHLAYINEARSFGPEVDCALSDAPEKHPPLVPLKQRAALLRALGVRDVYQHTGYDLPEMIRTLRPIAYVKGKDWQGNLPDEQVKACHDVGCPIVFTNTKAQSSSRMLAEYERKRNTAKLSAFEAFVQGQTPAEKPWEPVTDYSREARREVEAPQADIIADTFRNLTVFDYGCGFGYLVELLKERGMDARGWDPAMVEPFGVVTRPQLGSQYGAVICREVLEHLPVREIVKAVTYLVACSSRFIYVTTRFTAKSHLLDVDGSDDLDPTHISMLNQDFLRTLFVLEGCTRRADLEERLDWMKKGRVLVYEVPA